MRSSFPDYTVLHHIMFFMQNKLKYKCMSYFDRRRKYRIDDDRRIINYIVDNNWHMQTGGNVVWKNMQANKVRNTKQNQPTCIEFAFLEPTLRRNMVSMVCLIHKSTQEQDDSIFFGVVIHPFVIF